MPKKWIFLHCPPYIVKFSNLELADENGVVALPPMLLKSENRFYYKRHHYLATKYKQHIIKVESPYSGRDVRYLAAMEFHLRFVFYTHLWTAVRVAQKFNYPAYRAIEDFLKHYKITPDELDPDSLYRQWQRFKNKRKLRKHSQRGPKCSRGEQITLKCD